MSQRLDPQVWLWREPCEKYMENVMNFVKASVPNKPLIVLHSSSTVTSNGKLIVEFMFETCMNASLLNSERTTFLNYKDHLLALELCLNREKRKKESSSPEATDKELLLYHSTYVSKCLNKSAIETTADFEKYLDPYTEFLSHSNCTDLWQLYSIIYQDFTSDNSKLRKIFSSSLFVLLGSLDSEVLVSLTKLLTFGNDIFTVFVETSLDDSINESNNAEVSAVNVTTELVSLNDHQLIINRRNVVPATVEYVQELLLSFLTLLVNCRNELALSRAMTSPLIDLNRVAFTEIKHASVQKEMSMCQTVISFITKIRLGGKSYAPPPNCPLFSYVKEMEKFVDLINELQVILEETSSAELAIKKIITMVKKKLLKCKASLKVNSVEDTAKILIETSTQMLLKNQDSTNPQSTRMGYRTFNALYELSNHVNFQYSFSDPESVLNQKHTKRTPLNLPPLMGYFRTPNENSNSCDSKSSIKEENNSVVEASTVSVSNSSYFHNMDNNSVQKSCVNEKTPTKLTTFKNCLKEKVNAVKDTNQSMELKNKQPIVPRNVQSKGIKRSILGDISNSKPTKKANTNRENLKKLPVKKGKPQIVGQGHLTSFFNRI